ncbi:MAG: nicotinamide mononucleotide transporter [Cyanobacteria bacterium SIG29]|nr:nicotinamide mononucleotide transporter [Cyanobacteria bacterium SIG29]
MELKELIKFELKNWGKLEKIFFPLILFATVIISFLIKDDKIALVSALCGMSYTILAGKGKISCYFIGMIGTFCYSYIAFINGFYGNLCLYMLYYFPMEIVGIYKWRKHLKPENREVKKSRLSNKERIIYSLIAIIISISLSIILKLFNGITPYIDGTVTTLSVIGQLLTVKRCVEQWYVWFIVNLLSLIMWIFAYINDSNCFATIIMWAVYVVLSIYFLQTWQKELKQN